MLIYDIFKNKDSSLLPSNIIKGNTKYTPSTMMRFFIVLSLLLSNLTSREHYEWLDSTKKIDDLGSPLSILSKQNMEIVKTLNNQKLEKIILKIGVRYSEVDDHKENPCYLIVAKVQDENERNSFFGLEMNSNYHKSNSFCLGNFNIKKF
jgi:hypothetical protein